MKIREFRRLRKQNDAVKIWFAMVCVGVICFGRACYYGVKMYREIHSPVEYQIVNTKTNTGGKQGWDGVSDVLAVSDGRTGEINLRYRGVEVSSSFQELSREYLQKVYGITDQDGEKCFYLNEAAYKELQDAFMEQDVSLKSTGESENIILEMQYQQAPQEEEEVTEYRTAKMVIKKDGWISDTPQIVTAWQGAQSGEYQMVAFSKGDLTSTQREQIAKVGGMIEQENDVVQREYEVKELVLQVKYELIVALLTWIMAIAFRHYCIIHME